ncbi:MAG: toprim domain-containing protein [Rhodomicrobium sp.]
MSYASELSRRLADRAEAVCRAYLPNGRRAGRYWIVGDVQGSRGKSLFVKLAGERAGKWTDAATGQHGDLLDLIRLNKGCAEFRDTLEEARQFLREPEPIRARRKSRPARPPLDAPAAAEKLYSLSRPVPGTLAEAYLRTRGITASLSWPCLRFHPACYYRPDDEAPRQSWPALLGVVTDAAGKLAGLQRTYLARDGSGKAPLADPRRAMGHLLGNAVRFGKPVDIMAAGEGIETMLSLLSLFPALPMAAGLSAAHLAAILFPVGLRRLYVLRDNDAAGDFAEERLAERCREAGIDCRVLKPAAKDLNIDLRHEPVHAVKTRMLAQMEPKDCSRFLP